MLCQACAAASLPPPARRGTSLDDALALEVAVRACFTVFDYHGGIRADELVRDSFFPDPVSPCIVAAHGDCARMFDCVGLSLTPHVPATASCVGIDPSCDVAGDATSCREAIDPAGNELAVDEVRRCTSGACSAGACVRESLGTCDAGASCIDPTTLATCSSGQLVVASICDPGTACGTSASCPTCGVACVGTGATCPTDDAGAPVSSICDGDVVVECWSGREGARVDCASIGMRCDEGSAGHASCVAPAGGCTSHDALCDADVLVLCGPDGDEHRFDCVENGYTGCGRCEDLGWQGCTGAICAPTHRPSFQARSWTL